MLHYHPHNFNLSPSSIMLLYEVVNDGVEGRGGKGV